MSTRPKYQFTLKYSDINFNQTTMDVIKKGSIGDLLLKNQLITEQQLQLALIEQKKTGKKLGRVFVELGFIEELKFLRILSQHLKIPLLDLTRYAKKADVIKKLPEKLARRFRVLLLEDNAHDVLLAMVDPTDLMALDELRRVLGKTIRPAFVLEADLLSAIDQYYRRTDEIKVLAEQLRYELTDNQSDLSVLLASDKAADAPIVKLLKSVFEDAVQVHASDIHIEPQEHTLIIRFRIDGQLHLQTEVDAKITTALVQKLKLMAGLDISEKRVPHDGRFHINVRQQPVDVRVSTIPTVYGESVVMRLLIQNKTGFSLEKLGMPAEMLMQFRRLLQRSSGMVLLTGPTGSGKSTTLYAGLSELNSSNKKIITVEDPVEYRLAGVNQIQVNDKINLDFARILRSVLRQDPDIILIGEMRDQETAQIAMRAAMTGHLVLSTLHTNDTISTPSRLIDMGVEPFIVASSLLAIIAQRLLRLVCDNCVEPYTPDSFEHAWLGLELGSTVDDYDFVSGKGCNHCNHTGYQGRVGVYALLEMNNELVDAISHNDIRHFRALAHQQMVDKTMRYNAVQLAIAKRTTVTEAMWVSNQFEQH
jgi:MSHA biogenesis protein MshE